MPSYALSSTPSRAGIDAFVDTALETFEMLENYGVKLSNYERQINLGDLDAEYMLLIETPQDKVNYVLNNMDNIFLTIPTSQAPDWMVNEISSTYQY